MKKKLWIECNEKRSDINKRWLAEAMGKGDGENCDGNS